MIYNLALWVSRNKCKILLKTLEQLSIDNLILMNSCIEFTLKAVHSPPAPHDIR
jgi:hypothetical protein